MSAVLLSSLVLFSVDTAVHCTSVASSLTQAIAEERLTEKIIFSPANIQHSLALLYLGAEGTTAAQLQAGLKLGESKEVVEKFSTMFNKNLANKKINFQIATGLYLAEHLEIAKSFEDYAEIFNTQVMHVKLEVNYKKQINQWVHQQTSDTIKNLLTDHMEAVLVNSIYFKAQWQHTFSDGLGPKKDTVVFREYPGASVVQLKLKDTKISMLFIQPKADSGGLPGFMSHLTEVDLTQFPKEMQKKKVTLMAPKFTIEWDTSLKRPLGKLGIKSVFNDAHFNTILAGNKPLAFSGFRHKTYIQVDEKGIEVAGVTGTLPSPYSPPEEVDYEANPPLFFALIDEENVYFAGHVAHKFVVAKK